MTMRKNLLLLALLPMLGLHAQQLEGSWKGTLNVGLQKLTMVLHIDKDKPSVTISTTGAFFFLKPMG